jgi:hypothetical protein
MTWLSFPALRGFIAFGIIRCGSKMQTKKPPQDGLLAPFCGVLVPLSNFDFAVRYSAVAFFGCKNLVD